METYPRESERAGGAPAGRSGKRVVIVGATGLVGEVLLRVLEERAFPVSELTLLASERSAGARARFRGEEVPVEPAGSFREERFAGADVVFFAATGSLSRTLAPAAARRGALVIDKSSTWRADPRVPLVVPEVNPGVLAAHRGLVACPNCTTIGLVMVLEPLRRSGGLSRVVGTTFQAASGAGRAALEELESQEADHQAGRASEPRLFPRVLARNAIPQCDLLREDGETEEEAKLRSETRRILELSALPVEFTCVRVPVAVGHGTSLWVETERELELPRVLDALEGFPGLRLVREGPPPTALEAAGDDRVWVGRVRLSGDRRHVCLWQVTDNLRKGAATNSVQIAEQVLGETGPGR